MHATLVQLARINADLRQHPMVPENVREMLALQHRLLCDIVEAIGELDRRTKGQPDEH